MLALVERKTLEDAAASMLDGRLATQTRAYAELRRQTGCQVIFVLEAANPFVKRRVHHIPPEHIQGDLLEHCLRHGFLAWWTQDPSDTARFLFQLADRLIRIGPVAPPLPAPAATAMATATAAAGPPAGGAPAAPVPAAPAPDAAAPTAPTAVPTAPAGAAPKLTGRRPKTLDDEQLNCIANLPRVSRMVAGRLLAAGVTPGRLLRGQVQLEEVCRHAGRAVRKPTRAAIQKLLRGDQATCAAVLAGATGLSVAGATAALQWAGTAAQLATALDAGAEALKTRCPNLNRPLCERLCQVFSVEPARAG
jgi:hypothetical protein